MRAPWNRSLKTPEQLEAEKQERVRDRISPRNLFLYLGPALIVSMAYMDPGNYGTDIQSGASFGYDLLWTVWLANLMAMLLQYLSGKLGIATGKDLAELVRSSLKSRKRIVTYWLAVETAAAATDLAEYLGTVIALNLFGVPLLDAAIFGAADVIILLALTSSRFRIVEYFFMLFVSIIAIGFLYQVAVTGPSLTSIAYHSVAVSLDSRSALLVVGIIGATVMPHALFVHSTLTRDKLTTGSIEEKRRLRRLHLREVIITLTIAGLVNVAILVCAAPLKTSSSTSTVSSIKQFYDIMKPLYGWLAVTVFAITLLASGLASSTTGTLAGMAMMDGLLGTHVNKNLRRIVTRLVNVFPTTIAVLLGLQPFLLLIYSQVILSLMIPLPMIPLILYTSRRGVMGEFVNSKATTILGVLTAITILILNFYLISTYL
jgi:manganese transport protein